MSFPLKSIMVAGYRIKVRSVSADAIDGDEGAYDYETKVISLNQELPYAKQLAALKHEIRHCVLGLSGASDALTPEQEEQIVLAFDNLFDPAWERVSARLAKVPVAPPPTSGII